MNDESVVFHHYKFLIFENENNFGKKSKGLIKAVCQITHCEKLFCSVGFKKFLKNDNI